MKVIWLCIGFGLIAIFFVDVTPRLQRIQSSCSLGSSPSETAVADGVGFNIDFIDPRPAEVQMLAQSGVRWVRTDLKWDATELKQGEFDFSRYDRLVDALDKAGLRIVFILDYGNPLYDNGAPPRTEQSRTAFVRWSIAAARHFAGRGISWELYNEPNHSQFWPPRANVDEYVALALAVGRAFETQVPAERLIGPATSGIDFPFLETCFKAGLLKYWSGVSVHPYRRDNPETVAEDYCRLRDLIQQYAPRDKDVRVLAGEWGYSSAWPNIDQETQAQLLVRSWLANAASGVDLSIWYDWHDDGTNKAEAEHNFGVVSNQFQESASQPYEPKPAYYAAKTFTSVLAGLRFEKRLNAGRAEDHVFLFRRGTMTVIAAWTTAVAHQVVLPMTEGRFKSVSLTGENLGTVTATSNGLNATLTQSPHYFIRD